MNSSTIFSHPYYNQIFSLPNSIIYYITKNPSTSQIYEKLVQSCKYFYIKNPILLVNLLNIDSFGKCGCIVKNDDQRRHEIAIDKIKSKLWIIGSLNIFNFQPTFCSTKIIPKLYQCDATYLNLTSQNLCFNEFLILSSSIEICSFNKVKIQYPNGNEMYLEDVIQNMPKIKKFYSFSKPHISSNSVSKLINNIEHFSKLSVFSLKNVIDAFDIETFYNYSKKNQLTKITLHFDDSISKEFKQKIENIIDELIQMESFNFLRPILTHPRMGLQRYAIVNGWHRK